MSRGARGAKTFLILRAVGLAWSGDSRSAASGYFLRHTDRIDPIGPNAKAMAAEILAVLERDRALSNIGASK